MRPAPMAIVVAVVFSLVAGAAIAEDEPLLDCSNALSTFDQNACADKDFAAADKDLNAAYAAALIAVPGLASEKPYDAKSWENVLRKSQRAWLAYRDGECKDHVAMFWGGGTGATAQILGCMTDKTKARTKELLEDYEVK